MVRVDATGPFALSPRPAYPGVQYGEGSGRSGSIISATHSCLFSGHCPHYPPAPVIEATAYVCKTFEISSTFSFWARSCTGGSLPTLPLSHPASGPLAQPMAGGTCAMPLSKFTCGGGVELPSQESERWVAMTHDLGGGRIVRSRTVGSRPSSSPTEIG